MSSWVGVRPFARAHPSHSDWNVEGFLNQSINQSDFTLKTTQQILFGDPPFKVQAYFYLHRLSWSVFAAEI